MNIACLLAALVATNAPADQVPSATADFDLGAIVSAPFEYDPVTAEESIVSLGQVGDEGEQTLAIASPSFGSEDTWRWQIQGGYGDSFEGAQFYLGGVGFSWFFIENLSLDFEFNGMYFDQPDDTTWGGNFNLLLRWHLFAEATWSFYIDGGAGMLWTADDVPASGSSFNFTPQAGAGFSFEVAQDVRMMVGIRWHHISNANFYSDNPGRDSMLAYAAVSFPF